MGNLGKGQFGDLGKRQFREGEIWGMEKFGELWRGILDRGQGQFGELRSRICSAAVAALGAVVEVCGLLYML